GYELTVFFNPQWVNAQAESRLASVDPLVHGVLIDHPRGRSYLLPHTPAAIAHADDASRLLDRVSTQAGLGPDAWRRDAQADLLTFQTQRCEREPSLEELGT